MNVPALSLKLLTSFPPVAISSDPSRSSQAWPELPISRNVRSLLDAATRQSPGFTPPTPISAHLSRLLIPATHHRPD